MSEKAQTLEKPAQDGPDFTGIDAWVFDLDHTLYTFDAAGQAQMEERICRYVQRHYGLPRDEAWAVQKRYLTEYGSTLAGLILHDRIDPDAYHAEVNDLEALDLKHNAQLRSGLARLPGRLLVFTNNCGRYARDVLAKLGVEDLFGAIVDAAAMGYVPKPKPGAYEALLEIGKFDPRRAALFDDSARNLVPAHALGMRTVWFNDGLGQSNTWKIEAPERHIDHQTDDLATFLATIRI